MAILDVFKKKKRARKPEEKEGVKEIPEVKVERKEKKQKKAPKISKLAHRVLKEPHITEKATDLVSQNQYIFKVSQRANKNQIKKAIETLYDVNVAKVQIINIPKKQRRLGRISGFKKGYKKAIVKIKKGQKIELMPG